MIDAGFNQNLEQVSFLLGFPRSSGACWFRGVRSTLGTRIFGPHGPLGLCCQDLDASTGERTQTVCGHAGFVMSAAFL